MHRRPPPDPDTGSIAADVPIFPVEHAFVVQFGAGSHSTGRVEHVLSGRGARFVSGEELMAFMNDMLARVADAGA